MPMHTALAPVELTRLSRQCQAIAARLQAGPATNTELARLSLKYTSRISDLRAKGWNVVCLERDYATGVSVYALQPKQPPIQAELFSV
jgi:hypothetical protein